MNAEELVRLKNFICRPEVFCGGILLVILAISPLIYTSTPDYNDDIFIWTLPVSSEPDPQSLYYKEQLKYKRMYFNVTSTACACKENFGCTAAYMQLELMESDQYPASEWEVYYEYLIPWVKERAYEKFYFNLEDDHIAYWVMNVPDYRRNVNIVFSVFNTYGVRKICSNPIVIESTQKLVREIKEDNKFTDFS